MRAELLNWIATAWKAWMSNSGWMCWNLFLALVPLGLSFWLFRKPRSRVLVWGTGVLLGVTFVVGVRRYNFNHLAQLGRQLRTAYSVNLPYFILAIAIALVLMAIDTWWLQRRGSRSLLWWAGFGVFVLFLPNAPYVLTDIIHFYEEIRRGYSVWIVTLALVPQYFIFMVVGFEAYVLSLIYLGQYLKRHGWERWVVPSEFILHSLSAIGIYLGRFERFNSWHLFTQPDRVVMGTIDNLTAKRPILVIVVTFITIALLYWLVKQLTLGLMHYRSYVLQARQESS